MTFFIKKINNDEKFIKSVDEFILSHATNGEFINTLKYLSYHGNEKFKDRSIVIQDENSNILSVLICAELIIGGKKVVVSHPGTTFSGLITRFDIQLSEIETILDMITFFFKSEGFSELVLKSPTTIYSHQPFELLNFGLLRRNFKQNLSGLINNINFQPQHY
jgi:hypothetical protein